MQNDKQEIAGNLATLLGITSQLYTTRMNTLLDEYGFTLSQFSVLSHCAHYSDKQWTISKLAEIMEINQPGITKIVKKMVSSGFLYAQKDMTDSRRKHLQITPDGMEMLQKIYSQLSADIDRWFAEWSLENMGLFSNQLEMLNTWLDQNRLNVAKDN